MIAKIGIGAALAAMSLDSPAYYGSAANGRSKQADAKKKAARKAQKRARRITRRAKL
jgi:hypothetical protein